MIAHVALIGAIVSVGCDPNPPFVGRPAGAPADAIVFLITGYTNGNIEPCNCPGQPRGGLSRRKPLVDSLRPGGGEVFLLDNGNSVLLTPEPVADQYIWAGLGRLGYDAMAVGDQELDRGPAFFADAARAAGLPLVATNVRFVDRQKTPLGPTHRLIERGGRQVLVLSVVGPGAMHFATPQVRQEIEVLAPARAVADTLNGLRADWRARRPDAIVVLAVLDPTERDAAVAAMPSDVDLVVLSTERDRDVKAEKIGAMPVVFAPAMGRQVAAAEFRPGPGGRMRLSRAVGHPVEQMLPRDRKLWELYQSYTYDAQQRSLRLLGKAGGVKLIPSAQCGQCHAAQYQAWRKTKHGQAWATIVREGRTADPECMRCHTTGFGYQGGFRTAADAPSLADVGCQNCHQVDLGNMPPKRRVAVSEMTCRGCHTEPKSPKFEIAVYGPKVTCPKGRAVAATTRPLE
ncbi:MAG: multiheme c-type cytochrome [Phycisphaerae bacterium]|nr:multiheme c-type cytochrome [Phycisphaerae bacterium]